MKRLMLSALFLSLLLLTGCRSRVTANTTGPGDGNMSPALSHTRSDPAAGNDEFLSSDGFYPNPQEVSDEASAITKENPAASYREYDDKASAEAVPGANHALQEEGEGSGRPTATDDPEQSADQLDPSGNQTVTRTVSAAHSDQLGTSNDADKADTVLLYYTVLLQERLGSLFECQRKDLFWETAQPLHTIHRSNSIHQLILQAGCYDVSARLLEENLTVTPDWVCRKNPGIIVKIVSRSALGFGVDSTAAAEQLCSELLSRPDWHNVSAVKNDCVLLISEELIEVPHLQTAAMLLIAHAAYPELFADTDADEALRALLQEATGSAAEGILYYRKGSPL